MLRRLFSRFPDLSNMDSPRRWLALTLFTIVITSALSLSGLPAANLLGAMGAGILVAVNGGAVRIPAPPAIFCQSIIGCMVSRSISREILDDIYHRWPFFILMVMSVSLAATILGWLLARARVLPGSTAIWGVSPGAAMVMTLMAEDFGADARLVALMQYVRVVLVTLLTSALASVWSVPAAVSAAAPPPMDWPGFWQTMLLASGGMLAGLFLKLPGGPMLLPMIAGAFLNVYGVIHIELPWWLLIVAYSVVGWKIGLGFTREIVRHAIRIFPKIVAVILAVIFLCAVLACILGHFAGLDMVTAYLATSPGGMDAIAIIASTSSIGGNMSFVMAVQTTRLIVVSLTSPAIAAFVTKRTGMAPDR